MHRFYFNECLPQTANKSDFVSHLSNTIREFNKLLEYNIKVDREVVTQRLPSEIFFQSEYSLLDVIEGLPTRETKALAFSIFGRNYPLNAFFEDESEEILENMSNYQLTVDGVSLDALNLAIVQSNNGFVFSPALHVDVKIHPLVIKNIANSCTVEVHNLFGDETNTELIRREIVESNTAALNIYEQLLLCVGERRVTKQFSREFYDLTTADQFNIVQHFLYARNRNGSTPFFPDGDLIKDVTPNGNNPVYELRIFKPRALRIYFSEKDGVVYLASIGFKTSGNQNNDIGYAKKAIEKLIIVAK